MRVRINNGRDHFYTMNKSVEPIVCSQQIVLVIDPSKSNMGVKIGTVSGKELELLEFSGAKCGPDGRSMDTLTYCHEFRQYLKQRLKGCKIRLIAQEKTIMKKGNDASFISNRVLNDIRTQIDEMSLEMTGRRPEEINNWAWKKAILPDGYRGQQIKGSKIWLSTLDKKYRDYSDDLTDVICIFMYVISTLTDDKDIYCDEAEETTEKYIYMLTDANTIPTGVKPFAYNRDYGVTHNCNYYINRTQKTGYALVDIDDLRPVEIIGHATKLTTYSRVAIVVVPE